MTGRSGSGGGCPFSGASRRGFLTGAAVALAGAGVRNARAAEQAVAVPPADPFAPVPFFGTHQAGIATPQQKHSYFAAFDLTAKNRDAVAKLLRDWTAAAARMTEGRDSGEADGGSALDLGPCGLTVTFGFGAGLFTRDGHDRYGLASRRPEALVDLPAFNGDQLDAARSGGDLSVQACAEDAQAAFHAVRELARIAYGTATLRWSQVGFVAGSRPGSAQTSRNLMGFKDGTNNPYPDGGTPRADVPRGIKDVVWVADEGPDWMRGGSYLVARRIRISLEHWDRTEVDFQEEVIGRHKRSGAPLGKTGEFDALDLDRVDGDGNPVIADTAHARLGAAATNGGAQILRRAYSFNDGAAFTAERWPPWRQGMMYDAGLFFLCYQRDPRTGFIPINASMAKLDALNQFTTHVGSAVFAVPGGAGEGGYIGQRLFEGA